MGCEVIVNYEEFYMNKIEPTKEQIKSLIKLPKDKPVVMLNLLKYKKNSDQGNESGKTAYLRYVENVKLLISNAGGKLIFSGKAVLNLIGENSTEWDQVIMVEYPSPGNFIRMSSSPEYAKIHHDRVSGLEKTKLIVVHQD